MSEWLTINHMTERFGVCAETVSRWVKNPKLGFPRPVKINTRRYWKVTEVAAWESRMLPGVLPRDEAEKENNEVRH
jgi:predicted DNA-binding transcriptional regulator AlpA